MNNQKNKIIWGIRFSAFLGIILGFAMLISNFIWGPWVGIMLIPGIIGTYGLFLSLNELSS